MKAEDFREDYQIFNEAAQKFFAKELKPAEFKGTSGGFGSYAQRGAESVMLRLRMAGGRATKERLRFISKSIRQYHISLMHFTTCQAIQFHNLDLEAVTALATEALDYNIITRGGGGDNPRNVMVSPLSGVEMGEYFDVLPYAEAAGEYMLGFIRTRKFPRKYKCCFSNSPANRPHATFRDLGFTANPDGTFDVYSAGGLGPNWKKGVKVGEHVKPEKVLYYIEAMADMFVSYGNYESRARARSRYMQDVLGDSYAEKFREKLDAVIASGRDLDIHAEAAEISKKGDGTTAKGPRVIPQKQNGLYTVVYHPLGGCPDPMRFADLADAVVEIEGSEIRIDPEESCYIINLTGAEAEKILAMTEDSEVSEFGCSVACIGSSICQQGVRDSQALLKAIQDASREWDFSAEYLPKLHISGCPSSCGTHQIGRIGFRGAAKKAEGAMQPAFVLFVNGNDRQGEERFGEEIGTILQTEIPSFVHDLGLALAEAGEDFDTWYEKNRDAFMAIAGKYTA